MSAGEHKHAGITASFISVPQLGFDQHFPPERKSNINPVHPEFADLHHRMSIR
jgi:hypothetical protein